MRRRWIFFAPLAIVGFALFIGAGGWIVQQLWNWLAPALFAWHPITFWQALGMLALCRILFGGFGLHSGGHSHMRRHMGERCGHMTPEERERFRQGIRSRFGFGQAPGPEPGQ